jgi:hypothetical protein
MDFSQSRTEFIEEIQAFSENPIEPAVLESNFYSENINKETQ